MCSLSRETLVTTIRGGKHGWRGAACRACPLFLYCSCMIYCSRAYKRIVGSCLAPKYGRATPYLSLLVTRFWVLQPCVCFRRTVLPAFESLAPTVPWDYALKSARFGHVHGLSEKHGSWWKSRHANSDARLVLSLDLLRQQYRYCVVVLMSHSFSKLVQQSQRLVIGRNGGE